jgi:putative oxidoreductase
MKFEKSAKIISCLKTFCEKKTQFLQKYFSPILLLTLRIMIATVFLKSGLTKISNFDSTIFLFENEYAVPLLSPVIAAYLATICELGCSSILIAGLATRLAVLPLVGMTLVIQFTVVQNPEHFYWLAILSTLFVYGAGLLSLDRLIKNFVDKCQKN